MRAASKLLFRQLAGITLLNIYICFEDSFEKVETSAEKPKFHKSAAQLISAAKQPIPRFGSNSVGHGKLWSLFITINSTNTTIRSNFNDHMSRLSSLYCHHHSVAR